MRQFTTRFLLVAVLATSIGGCAAVKKIARTADDIAKAACELFGTEHPEEFERLARSVLPPGAEQEAEAQGFDPIILCQIKEVVQPFIDDLLEQQAGMAAGLSQGTSGGDSTE